MPLIHESLLKNARQIPEIGFPHSSNTVEVRLIDTTSCARTQTSQLFHPPVLGHETLETPSWAFLITNKALRAHLLFDLGTRKDWADAFQVGQDDTRLGVLNNPLLEVYVKDDVVDILDADPWNLGITSKTISAVMWSHHHFDSRGDITRFPESTRLIVGPGLRATYGAGLPKNGPGKIAEAEFQGREIIELEDSHFNINIGGFMAHDAFGDGSLYLMSTPGHAAGHMSCLARVTTGARSTFVLLGGDVASHCGELRPSPYNPLPTRINLKKTSWHYPKRMSLCGPILRERLRTSYSGASIRDHLHPAESATEPFYMTRPEPAVFDYAAANESIIKMEVFDAHEDVLVCLSHDSTLMDVLPAFPYTFNDWKIKGYKEKLRWEFLRDFDLDSL